MAVYAEAGKLTCKISEIEYRGQRYHLNTHGTMKISLGVPYTVGGTSADIMRIQPAARYGPKSSSGYLHMIISLLVRFLNYLSHAFVCPSLRASGRSGLDRILVFL